MMGRTPNRNSTHFFGDGCDPPHKADEACGRYTVNVYEEDPGVPCVYCGHGPREHR